MRQGILIRQQGLQIIFEKHHSHTLKISLLLFTHVYHFLPEGHMQTQ